MVVVVESGAKASLLRSDSDNRLLNGSQRRSEITSAPVANNSCWLTPSNCLFLSGIALLGVLMILGKLAQSTNNFYSTDKALTAYETATQVGWHDPLPLEDYFPPYPIVATIAMACQIWVAVGSQTKLAVKLFKETKSSKNFTELFNKLPFTKPFGLPSTKCLFWFLSLSLLGDAIVAGKTTYATIEQALFRTAGLEPNNVTNWIGIILGFGGLGIGRFAYNLRSLSKGMHFSDADGILSTVNWNVDEPDLTPISLSEKQYLRQHFELDLDNSEHITQLKRIMPVYNRYKGLTPFKFGVGMLALLATFARSFFLAASWASGFGWLTTFALNATLTVAFTKASSLYGQIAAPVSDFQNFLNTKGIKKAQWKAEAERNDHNKRKADQHSGCVDLLKVLRNIPPFLNSLQMILTEGRFLYEVVYRISDQEANTKMDFVISSTAGMLFFGVIQATIRYYFRAKGLVDMDAVKRVFNRLNLCQPPPISETPFFDYRAAGVINQNRTTSAVASRPFQDYDVFGKGPQIEIRAVAGVL